ncbi:MAG: DUF5074 domain-containing protein [Bacteroidota bacterium]
MQVLRRSFFACCVFLLLCPACQVDINTDDEDRPPPKVVEDYQDGVFIANIGNLQNASGGSISFYSRSTDTVVNQIYQLANGGEVLGGGVRSIVFSGDYAYILAEADNVVRVVDADNFELVKTIEGFQRPRQLLLVNPSKAYVSQWGQDGISGSIEVIDLANNSRVKNIPTRPGPERMIKTGTHVYVANMGGVAIDSVLTKISMATDQVLQTIEVGLAPHSMGVDQNNALWAICGGLGLGADAREGRLVRIVNDEVHFSVATATGAANLVMHPNGQQFFFTMDNWVFAMGIEDINLPLAPFLARSYTGLGIDPDTEYLIGCNAKNQISPGQVDFFSLTGEEQGSFPTGIFPDGLSYQ